MVRRRQDGACRYPCRHRRRATHHAHHGRHLSDPAVHYKGNFGNLLFFWDVLFGTAKITRSYPESYGVENLPPATLGQQLLWPIFPENKDMAADIPGSVPAKPLPRKIVAG